jgi:hypothetical protein
LHENYAWGTSSNLWFFVKLLFFCGAHKKTAARNRLHPSNFIILRTMPGVSHNQDVNRMEKVKNWLRFLRISHLSERVQKQKVPPKDMAALLNFG